MGCHLEVGPGCRTHSGHIPVWYTCAVRHRISKIDQNSSAQKSMTHEHHEHFWMIWMDMSILILICLCAPITAQCPHFSPQLVMNPCPCGTGPFASAAPSADREQPPAPVCIFWGALNLEKVLEMTLTWSERCPFSRQIRIHMHGYTAIHCLSLSLYLLLGGITCLLPQTGVYLQNTHNIRNHVASIWNADILFLELNPVQHRVWEFLSMLDTLSCLRPFLRNKDTLEPMSSSQNPRHFYLLSLLIRFSYWYRNELYKSSH